MLFFVFIGLTSALTPGECIEKLTNYSIDGACFQLLLSKLLGYLMISASLMLKVPQLLKIYKNSSVEGISLTSFYFEVLGFSIMSAYSIHNSNPFSTYGELVIISIQCILQVLLFWTVGNVSYSHKIQAGTFFVFGWFIPLFGDFLPEEFWTYVPVSSIFMNLVVKFSQIKTIFVNGSTGNLSFITNFMNLVGTIARIFTTFTELNDKLLILSYGIGATCNFVIIFQFLIYWNSKPKED